MKKLSSLVLIFVFSVTIFPKSGADFSGTWVFNSGKSQNVGMMSSMQLTTTIRQTDEAIIFTEAANFNGQDSTREVRYDLKSKPVTNKTAMGQISETVSKWVGNKLVTTWTSEGAIAGTKVVSTETRYLSTDGKQMTLESVRGSNKPIIMIFEKK